MRSEIAYPELASRLLEMSRADLEVRNKLISEGRLGEGYDPEMEALHSEHARQLDLIIEEIGLPSVEKVGKEANEAAWLIVQHSIGHPETMKRYASLLEAEVEKAEASPRQLAYLTDRIAVFEGRRQMYGTNFDWDENGELSPTEILEPEKVNERRRSLGLNSIEEQTETLRRRAREENELPPADREKRNAEFDSWRRSVGWVD